MNRTFASLTLAAATLLTSACDKPAASPSTPSATGVKTTPNEKIVPPTDTRATTQAVGLPAGMVVNGTVADATPVAKCKTAAKLGDTVTIKGRIGGSRVPFNANRAVFTIVDPALKSCADHPDDHCETPWDYCCETKETLASNVATVEIVGTDGKPLQFTVKGAQGLQPLATVAVTGKVMERNDQGVFVVRAEKISVQP